MPREIVVPANIGPDFETVLAQDPGIYSDRYPVARYGRTFVTHSGIALRRLRVVPETLFPRAPSKDKHLTRYAQYKFVTAPRTRRGETDLLLLHNHWSSGFYHWAAEGLLKVQFVDPAAHTVLVPGGFPRFVRDSLELFDWRAVALIPPGHCIAARALTVIGNPPTDAINPTHVDWVRTVVRQKCGATPGPPVRIHLTRRNAQMRRIVNEAEVLPELEQFGFETIDAAQLSFAEQVRLFSRCEALVAPHGAGLTNMIFMSPGSRVLELYRELSPALPLMNIDYWNLASAAGLRYYYQFCEHGPRQGPKIDDVDLHVDIAKLSRNLSLMFDS
jgi:capsular polysaccharide biosynthesis protein